MNRQRNFTFLLLPSDLLALALSFLLGQLLRLPDFDGSIAAWWQYEGVFRVQSLAVVTLVMLTMFGGIKQHYSQRKPFWDELYDVLVVVLFMLFADAAMMFLNKWQFSRMAFGTQWMVAFALLPGLRLALKWFLARADLWQVPVVLVGVGSNARESLLALNSESLMGYRLESVVVPPGRAIPAKDEMPAWIKVPVIAWPDFERDIARYGSHQLVIALEPEEQSAQEQVARRVMLACNQVLVVPPTRGLPLLGMEPLHAFSHEVLLLRARNNLRQPLARFLKRGFDLVCSILLLVLLSPLFAWLCFKVRQSGGPAFFGHTRIGCNGVPFACYKFRTMVPDADAVLAKLLRENPAAKEEWDREFKLRDDPRVTAIGDFLRRSSLDELPQLWNVLRGDMSLVGPRPVIRDELPLYREDLSYYLQVRPGMSGLWQVSGRNDVDYDTRVALDAWYVRNWSLWNDIVILIKTVRVVLGRDGAY